LGGGDQGAAGAEELGAVEGVLDLDAPAGAVAVEVDDLFPEVAHAKHEVAQTRGPQQTNLVRKEWLARDLDEELGDLFRNRPEPGGHATGENCDRKRGRHGREEDWEDLGERKTGETEGTG
jgi:hypothetical protein